MASFRGAAGGNSISDAHRDGTGPKWDIDEFDRREKRVRRGDQRKRGIEHYAGHILGCDVHSLQGNRPPRLKTRKHSAHGQRRLELDQAGRFWVVCSDQPEKPPRK